MDNIEELKKLKKVTKDGCVVFKKGFLIAAQITCSGKFINGSHIFILTIMV